MAVEIPALVDPNLVVNCTDGSPSTLVPPLGSTVNLLPGTYSFEATELDGQLYGWRPGKHSDFVDQALPVIWGWYHHLFFPDEGGFPQGILPTNME
jgi:hypothetical protein